VLLLGLTPFLRSGLGGSLQPCSPGNALSLRRFLSGDETTTYSPRHHPILGNEGGHRSYASSSPEAMQSVHSNPPRNQVVEDCITEAALNPALSSRRRIRRRASWRREGVSRFLLAPTDTKHVTGFPEKGGFGATMGSFLSSFLSGDMAAPETKRVAHMLRRTPAQSGRRGVVAPERSVLRFQGTENFPASLPHTRIDILTRTEKRTKVQSSGTGCHRNTNGTRTGSPRHSRFAQCLRCDLSG
jgi:hypothetical protein